MNFGEADFLQYWTSYQLLRAGADPYNPEILLKAQQALGWEYPEPVMNWTAPWVLTLLSPILAFPFHIAAKLMFSLNVFLLFAGLFLLKSVYETKNSNFIFISIFSALNLSVFFALNLGQVSLLVFFAVCLLLWAGKHAFSFPWIFIAPLLSIKPHLVYLLVLPIIKDIFLEKKIEKKKLLLVYAFPGMLGLALLSYWQLPSAFNFWINRAQYSTSPLLIKPSDWETLSFATQIRFLWIYLFDYNPAVIMFILPGLTFLLVSLTLYRKNWFHDLKISIPFLLPLSLLTAPYGWIYDCVILIIPQYFILNFCLSAKPAHKSQTRYLLAILSLTIFLYLWAFFISANSAHFWFYPAAILVLLVYFFNNSAINRQKAFI